MVAKSEMSQMQQKPNTITKAMTKNDRKTVKNQVEIN